MGLLFELLNLYLNVYMQIWRSRSTYSSNCSSRSFAQCH